ncbi:MULTISPECIES: DUF1294 domain-containing protein [Enterococcus]|uniref:DUF1294 domain-containing protein n=1 Tax=Enterococcus mundtii TaxID=53346 RepID=A0A1L8UNZ6_ENTMU|nr:MULTISPECIES: DUF1294 domain-containing protein [Enterococcus]MBE6172252.1 DUF1294 domain-containing protein [Enterococcus faecium]GEN17362.1 hypothetical protein LAC02_06430 [Ligilactobacillus acidipiscis]AUB52778.1 hypothetical protein EM4838_07180 [Enterococcus mundtii]AZP92942.1 DUF1294 domain-containing protein [Enterococcus mundtii]EOH62111.1 hypothetical protein UAC_01497 [Enterococcus mundtii ATCC 882]
MEVLMHNPLWFYLFIVNVYLFGLMGYDKRQAKKGAWRVPESNLLFVSLLGGGLGGLFAQRIFRHKTKKKKFTIVFMLGIMIDLVLIYFFH